MLYQFLCLFIIYELWKFQLALHNFFIDVVRSFCWISKRKDSTQKLIQTDSKWPKINKIIISLPKNNIRGHIMRCPYNRKSLAHLIVFSPYNFWCREIDEFHVSLRVNHKILRFDISADYLVILEVLKNKDDGCSIEYAIFSGKKTNISDYLIEILSTNVLL